MSWQDLSSSFVPLELQTRARLRVRTVGTEVCQGGLCQGRNVLGVLPGRDARYADEIVIVGAHYDHLGEVPDGTAWVGANDDASGVAVLLEIARTWHEQGYVPRRTVLFVAWDAEEMGLLGSHHYVEHPRYPLDRTVAKIQLDMVGSGENLLEVDGETALGDRILAVAESLGVEGELTNSGGSDHVPFLAAGVPADLLIWSHSPNSVPHYHRPGDIPEAIDLQKLDAVGRITGVALLGLADAEPALLELVSQRTAALRHGDLEGFLRTSLPELEESERSWFSDAQGLRQVDMQVANVRLLGRVAHASVQVNYERPIEGGEGWRPESASAEVGFVHRGGQWQWAGPHLAWLDPQDADIALAVACPPGTEESLAGLGEAAGQRYREMADLLGLSGQPAGKLLLFPTSDSLRASTSLSLPDGADAWVGRGVLKLVYGKGISTSVRLDNGLAELLLANEGVTEEAAPWLWEGLPLVLRSQAAEGERLYLPQLQVALAAEDPISREAASWAVVTYLRDEVGWPGIGRLIGALGQACKRGQCDDEEDVDAVLRQVLGVDAAGLDGAWHTRWRETLKSVQADLDDLLAARTEALLRNDREAFLNTVDGRVPGLLAEQERWFASLSERPLESITLVGSPLSVPGDDGEILASVTMQYRMDEAVERRDSGAVSLLIRFTASQSGYRWAGSPLATLRYQGATALYAEGQRDLAQALIMEAKGMQDRLAAELGIEAPTLPILKLYQDGDAFRASIAPWLTLIRAMPSWSAGSGSIKVYAASSAGSDSMVSPLAVQVARHVLTEMGVQSEWLLTGVSIYLSERLDRGVAVRAAATGLSDVLDLAVQGALYDFAAMPPDYALSEADRRLADAQAWDAVRYIAYTHGWEAVLALLQESARGQEVETAVRRVLGLSLPEFVAAWSTSASRGHVAEAWLEVARSFDVERALEHVEHLSSPRFAGRQAGSPGAEAAAAYIADKFASSGLLPVGDVVTGQGPEGDTLYEQQFPISYTTFLSLPQLAILTSDGQIAETFSYREDFVTRLQEMSYGGNTDGELIWVADETYSGMELSGKIVLRRPSEALKVEVARAVEHGARGLILVGQQQSQSGPLAKDPFPVAATSQVGLPVLELTQRGFERLLGLAGHTRASISAAPPALAMGLHVRIEIPLAEPRQVNTANVLGLLPGSDPVLRERVVIIGAHYDHVGDDPNASRCTPGDAECERSAGRRYAGANDNASGVGVLLEIARVWHEAGYRPRYSVLFAAWGGQEPGELGSRHYVQNPVYALDDTVAALQLDAVGGGEGYFLVAQGDPERDGLLRFSFEVAEGWLDGRLTLRRPSNRGDHIPFHQAGVPALLLTWRGASEENWPTALADEVQPYRLGVTGRMTALAAMSIAR